jgi:hypothetical protein
MMTRFSVIVLCALAPLAQAVCNPGLPEETPSQVFSDGGAWVQDRRTGLLWQRCPLGWRWEGQACQVNSPQADSFSWQQALAAANADALGGFTWRLPNKQELLSLVERRCAMPAINEQVFPGTPSAFFWTSTPALFADGYAWFQDFGRGEVLPAPMQRSLHVRLVSDGRARPAQPVSP